MSKDMYVNVHRNGIQVPNLTNIYVQLDNMSQYESAYYGGAAPYLRYTAYTLANLDIRQSDTLIDISNVDPFTGVDFYYRAVSDPEKFPDNHMEIIVDKIRGK